MPVEASHLNCFERDKDTKFIRPDYRKYCVSNIPTSVISTFGRRLDRPSLPDAICKNIVEGSQKIVVLLMDGFGYNLMMRNLKIPFLEKMIGKGIVAPITSVFPSTTAAALTSINTGLTPQEHALPEWFVYFREIDMILTTIPFKPMDPRDNRRFRRIEADPRIIYDGKTVYQELEELDVKTFVFAPNKILGSTYSRLTHRGAAPMPYVNTSDMAVMLRKLVEKEEGPAYIFVYIDILDYISHKYGPSSEELVAQLETISFQLQKGFVERAGKKVSKETSILLTADHGQIDVSPERLIFLDDYLGAAHFKKGGSANVILPTGSPRDVFLNVEPLELIGSKESLVRCLSTNAKTLYAEDALKAGLFGIGRINDKFSHRIGNILVLPLGNNLIWYRQPRMPRYEFLGHHGGLSEDEMIVPFCAAKLCDIQ